MLFAPISLNMALLYASPIHIHHLRMGKLNALLELLMIVYAVYYSMLECHLLSGLKLYPLLHTFLNAGHVKQPASSPHISLLLGTPPELTHLKVFGCLCFPNLDATASNKLSAQSSVCPSWVSTGSLQLSLL